MAYNLQRIDPLDLQPRKAIGVRVPFSGKGVFDSTFTTADAIKYNLINLLLTEKEERVFNPSLGSRLRRSLFNNIDQENINILREDIVALLSLYFPTLNIEEIQIEGTPDSNSLLFSLKYNITNTNISDEIIVNIEI